MRVQTATAGRDHGSSRDLPHRARLGVPLARSEEQRTERDPRGSDRRNDGVDRRQPATGSRSGAHRQERGDQNREGDALRQVLPQPAQSPIQPHADGGARLAEARSDLARGESVEQMQAQRLPVPGRQSGHAPLDDVHQLGVEQCIRGLTRLERSAVDLALSALYFHGSVWLMAALFFFGWALTGTMPIFFMKRS